MTSSPIGDVLGGRAERCRDSRQTPLSLHMVLAAPDAWGRPFHRIHTLAVLRLYLARKSILVACFTFIPFKKMPSTFKNQEIFFKHTHTHTNVDF